MARPAEPEGTPNDGALMARMRAGSVEAFDALFRQHYPRLVAAAQSLLHDRDAAEEVAQEVMLELWRRREELVVESGLRGYLHRAVRNRALNRIRHERTVRQAEPLLAQEAVRPAPADREAREHEIDAALRRAMDAMPPRCREVFELSRVHRLRYAEIADTLEISIKTVEAQMGKALRIAREHLEPWLRAE